MKSEKSGDGERFCRGNGVVILIQCYHCRVLPFGRNAGDFITDTFSY